MTEMGLEQHYKPPHDIEAATDFKAPRLPGERRRQTRWWLPVVVIRKAFLWRLAWGCLGGLALLAPVLLMALVPGPKTPIITVCVSTVIFTLVISAGLETYPENIMGLTAAYTAVLVVFLGASS